MGQKAELKQQIKYAKLTQKLAADPLIRLQATQTEIDLRKQLNIINRVLSKKG